MTRMAPVSGVALAVLLAACGGTPSPTGAPPAPPTPPPTTSAPPPRPAAAETAPDKAEVAGGVEPGYDPKGRRDPFGVPEAVEGSAGTSVASARLTGIVRSPGGRVLALVETPDGLGYILRPGDTFGDGRLIEVGSDTVVFNVAARRGADYRVVLRLGGEE